MKKLFLVMLLILTVTGMALAGCGGEAAAPAKTVELVMGVHSSSVSWMCQDVFVPWIAEVAERTGGRVKIELFPDETMGASREQYDLLKSGGIDVTDLVSTHYPGYFPMSEVFNLPFTVPFMAKTKDGEYVRDIIFNKYIAKYDYPDVKALWPARYAPIVLHMVDTPVRTPADLKGKLIGVPGGKALPDLAKALGASPEQVPTGDLYTALERGMIEGNLIPLEVQLTQKLWEVTNYVTLINTGSAIITLVMSMDKWNEISANDQKTMDELSLKWGEIFHERQFEATEEAEKEVKAHGSEVIHLTPAERELFVAATMDLENALAKSLDEKGLPGSDMMAEIHQLLGD